MKILFVASAYSVHSRKWINYFLGKGHEIHLISLEKPQPGLDKRINLYLGSIFNLFHFIKLIKRIRPDIIHAHYAGFNGLIAAFSGVRPFVLTAWGSDILVAGQSMVKRPLVKFVLNRAGLITCDAEHLKKAMVKMGVSSQKIKIIRFGVDTKKFLAGPRNQELKNKLGLIGFQSVISLRNFEPIYDIETLIKAAPLVLKEIPKIKFMLMGRGSHEKELKQLVKKLNLEPNVIFLARVLNDEIPDYLRLADVYVSTSLSDAGIASSTAEAMACELPVVVTDFGENRKWVESGENGFVIPVKSPEILAEKIIYLLKNNEVGKQFGRISREVIKEKNDYYGEMSKVEKIYNQLTIK